MTTYDVSRISHAGLREVAYGAYTLVRYTKPLKSLELGNYRSVVYKGDRLVAFSPPRSTPLQGFQEGCPSTKNAVVREFVDGMMIYVWYDADADRWVKSTRSCMEGEKVFRRGTKPLSQDRIDEPPTPAELFETFVQSFASFYDLLDKSNTYLFTLMDPTSFNVVKPSSLTCYLTNVYKILEGNKVLAVPFESVLQPSFPVNVLPIHYFRSYEDITGTLSNNSYSMKGFMVYDPLTEKRAKILNPAFLKVHDLLSSKPNFNEIVLDSIVAHKNSNELAVLHPDFPKNIEAVERAILRCANQLYSYYLECFVKKAKAHKDFPALYRTHMYELHKMYLNSFRQLGFRMNKTVVLDYVRNVPAPILVPLLGIH